MVIASACEVDDAEPPHPDAAWAIGRDGLAGRTVPNHAVHGAHVGGLGCAVAREESGDTAHNVSIVSFLVMHSAHRAKTHNAIEYPRRFLLDFVLLCGKPSGMSQHATEVAAGQCFEFARTGRGSWKLNFWRR